MHARHSAFSENGKLSSRAGVKVENVLRPVRDDPLDDLTLIMKYSNISMKVIPVGELERVNQIRKSSRQLAHDL